MSSRPIKQTSVFRTHRGRKARAVLVSLSAAAVLMTVWNGQGGESTPKDQQAQQQAAVAEPTAAQTTAQPPKVAAAVANPDKPYRGANKAEDADSTDSAPSASSSTENPEQYQGMLNVAQSTAVSFGTYSYKASPEQWVATISGLDPNLRKVLLKSAKEQSWPQIRKQRVVADAALVGESPKVVYYRAESGKAQVVVSLSQKSSSTEGRRTHSKSIAVTLTRQGGKAEPGESPSSTPTDTGAETDAPDGGGATWRVTGIDSN